MSPEKGRILGVEVDDHEDLIPDEGFLNAESRSQVNCNKADPGLPGTLLLGP